jgi:methionine-rich copper-binding protein CopC
MRALTRSRVVSSLMLAALCLTLWSAPALAHARLVQESPSSGASLDEPPDRVRLRFSESVDAEFDPLKVYDAEGNRVDEDNARIDPGDARVLLVDLKELPEGSYRVEWRVTSIDGHVIEDAYAFNVTASSSETEGRAQDEAEDTKVSGAQPAAKEAPEPPSQEDTGGIDRTVLYGILTFGVLGLVVLALVAARSLRRRKTRGIQ